MLELREKEQVQDELRLQSTLGEAIHHSLQTIIREPLPNEMALLLLQLALAQVTGPKNGETWKSHISSLIGERETELDRATWHVANAKLIVARQRERIIRLQLEHRQTEDAQRLLNAFIESLASLEHHQRLLREEAEGKDRTPEWLFSRLAAGIPRPWAE
jgi:hypothetical protein